MGAKISIHPREIMYDNVDSIGVAQDRDQWRDLLKTIINFWVS
jgi:hypothetical protein